MRVESSAIPPKPSPLHAFKHPEPTPRLPDTPGTGKRPAAKPAPCSPAFDSRQCRIWLNEAQREIDRLRRSTALPPTVTAAAQPTDDPTRVTEPHALHDPARAHAHPTPKTARMYSVTPIGTLELPDRPAPPHPEIVTRAQVMRVTNLGTFMDVLA